MSMTEQGFTLVEILVVLTIIGLIAAVTAPQVFRYLDRSKVEASKTQLRNVQNALELFYIDQGRYPTAQEQLTALIEAPADVTGWTGPYLRDKVSITDAWGGAFAYEVNASGSQFRLTSLGRDRKVGGEGFDADISVSN